MTARRVRLVVTAHQQMEGGGFLVRRPFPTRGLDGVDPLLMLDEMGPVEYGPGEALGAPDHPHRGFETVTYILDGEAEHADSAGHAGTLKPGDVQWMTAGSGVVHREMPSAAMQRDGGRMHGFQLWVNLPAKLKMTTPRYVELPAADIPVVPTADGLGEVRVVAGRALGVDAATRTHTPITYLHVRLQAGSETPLELTVGHNVCVYVFDGEVDVAGRTVQRGQLALLTDGDSVVLGSDGGGQALVLGGQPIGEPVAWQGPFVMNTSAELRQAMVDYQRGEMGRIPPEIVRA